jgi:hypothetical protein
MRSFATNFAMPFTSPIRLTCSCVVACALVTSCQTSRRRVPCDPAHDSACRDASPARAPAPNTSGTTQSAVSDAPSEDPNTQDGGFDAALGSTRNDDSGQTQVADDDAGTSPPATAERDPNALVGTTVPLAVMAGMYAKGYERELYGTDLGWTFAHEGKLWVLFGDSWRTEIVDLTLKADDAFARISLDQYPNGRAVEDWVRAHPAPAGTPVWRAAGPKLEVELSNGPGSIFAPSTVWRDGSQLYTGPALTPLAGFSNGRSDAFGIFFRYAHVQCESGECAHGFECDADLGREALETLNPPCVPGSSLSCIRGPGYCQDRSSSMYDSTESGRTKSVVVRHEVGSARSDNPTRFDTQAWDTNRFFNLTARSVEDFDPSRAQGNDHAPASGSMPEHDVVFLWGRPHFAGIGAEGRDAELYFAWAPMPERDANGQFAWQVHYFAGVDSNGTPQFVDREVDSRPLDLDAAQSGEQPEEILDVVGQMSITWLPEFQRFVMICGGDIAEGFFSAIFRSDAAKVRHDPRGALYVRFAEQPWGPWTAPRALFLAGDRRHDAEAVEQYAPGGLLYHNRCQGPTCAGDEPSQHGDTGVLHGPSIVEPWTEVRSGSVDLYWFLSTWSPYQVVLAKTTLTAADVQM